jgi:RNA polymerase sigma factor (sigma-70 family)
MIDNLKQPFGDRALQQMWYKPARRIRTDAASARATLITDQIARREELGDMVDEHVLFVALHTCAFQAKKCCQTGQVNKRQCRKWVSRWRLLRDYIVERNLGLVYSMMTRLRLAHAHYDDIHSDGLMALVRAVERFDPWRGVRFSTYACNLIVRDLINVSKRAARYRNLFPYQHEESFERPQPMPDHETGLYVERLQRALDKNLAGLTDLETTIIEQRFPKDRPKRRTLQEIGRDIGVSKERVRQIQMKALGKLREVLDADPVLNR